MTRRHTALGDSCPCTRVGKSRGMQDSQPGRPHPPPAPLYCRRQEAFFHYLFGVSDREDCWGALDLRTQRSFLFIPRCEWVDTASGWAVECVTLGSRQGQWTVTPICSKRGGGTCVARGAGVSWRSARSALERCFAGQPAAHSTPCFAWPAAWQLKRCLRPHVQAAPELCSVDGSHPVSRGSVGEVLLPLRLLLSCRIAAAAAPAAAPAGAAGAAVRRAGHVGLVLQLQSTWHIR